MPLICGEHTRWPLLLTRATSGQVVDFFHPNHFAHLLSDSPSLTTFNNTARILFVVTFIALRTLWFPAVIFGQVLPDLLNLLFMQDATGKLWLYVGMSFAIAFTGLQLYWSVLLCKQVRKALRGDENKEPKEAEDATYQLREEATPLREW